MLKWAKRWFATPSLESFDSALSRERLIQAGRIVVIDDESPLLIDELRSTGFAVDHDRSGSDLRPLDAQLYDVAIVDYHGVGQRIGPSQGLELIRHIRRVSPRTRIIAYTSRSLSSTESEFFRQSHNVLPKDLGLGESLALIEGELRKAFSKQHLFDALIAKLEMNNEAARQETYSALVRALDKRDDKGFRKHVSEALGAAAAKSVETIIDRTFG